ncbi:unnamed protein product [Bathycoccus prasinos]
MKPPQKQRRERLNTKSDNKKKHKKRGGISDRSFAEKNVTIIEGKEEKKKREGEVEEEEEEAKDSIKAWEEKNSNPGWNVVESSCPLSEEQVREVEAYFLAGKKRGRLVPKYALYLLDEDEEEEEGGGGRVAREKHHFGSKNKLGVAIPGVGANVVDAKRLILSTNVSRSVFMKLFDEKIDEKIKVSDAQCLKKETKALAKFLAKSIATVAILPVGKRITREAYQKMQKENFCIVRGYSQKNMKHASEHHIGPSARRSGTDDPV